MTREPFFLESSKGRRFALLTRPAGECRGVLLHLHALGEEMNKSRRMVSLAARAFAGSGWAVLQLDHYGCGDSCGDFGDATWQDWIDDVSLAREWLRENLFGPIALWTLRAGSLTATAWLEQSGEHCPLLLWQPVSAGKQHVTQFLRLKMAATMQTETEGRAVMAALRASLDGGECVEVAGYTLAPGLVRGMESATLSLPKGYVAPVAVLELVSESRTDASPGIDRMVEGWRDAGVAARVTALSGPAFWQTQEIETAPGLIDRSIEALESWP